MKWHFVAMVIGCASVMVCGLSSLVYAGEPVGPFMRGPHTEGQHVGARQDSLFNDLSCKELDLKIKSQPNKDAEKSELLPSFTMTYGSYAAQKLDVHIPQHDIGSNTPFPIIIMVHGGMFCGGDKDQKNVVFNKVRRWLPKGFLFVSVNYRTLQDDADVLTQASDVASAIAYVQEHAAQWGGNPAKVIVMGHSSGAHLVSLLSADQSLAAKYGARQWLGTVSLDGVAMNVEEAMQHKHPIVFDEGFGKNPANWAAVSPVKRVSNASLPWLGVCSTKRPPSCMQANMYREALRRVGVKASVLVEDLTHGEINKLLGLQGAYTDSVETFLSELDPGIQRNLQ